MPSQAETIAALQGLSPVTTPQSPADPYAAAMTFGSAIGLPDAIKALKGKLTPEEAKNFALTSAMGLLPGGKAETVAAKTMGELLPHLYPATSTFAKMTPKEYLGMFGSDLPKQLPQDVENVLKPHMQPAKTGKVPGPGPVQQYAPSGDPLSLHQQKQIYESAWANGQSPYGALSAHMNKFGGADDDFASDQTLHNWQKQLTDKYGHWQDVQDTLYKKQYGVVPPKSMSDDDIEAALKKNPGASIFNVANTHVGGPSTQYSPSPLTNSMLSSKGYASPNSSTIPREGGVPYTPLAAQILGRSENLVHGTRMGEYAWKTPTGGSMGTEADALRLPDDELGVHFGNPKQAQVFAGDFLDQGYKPRYYPVVVAANNPLRLPDLGSWGPDNVSDALAKHYPKIFSPEELYNAQGGYKKMSYTPPEEQIKGLRGLIQSKGYDSVVYKNTEEDPGHDSFIKFTPSPEAPDFVSGVRSPWAAFDPSKIMRPELAAGLAGGTLAAPAIDPNLLKALTGGQTDQQQ